MGKKMKYNTVRFNIGGTRYEVSQTLLDQYPDSMLSKSASKEWHDSEKKEIFIERDGSKFKFVLDFMRDGKVVLPISQAKAAIIAELEYFNFEFDPDDIDDNGLSTQMIALTLPNLQKWKEKLETNIKIEELACFCFDNFFGEDILNYDYDEEYEYSKCLTTDDIKAVNKILREVGIKVKMDYSPTIQILPLTLEEIRQA